MVGSAHNVSGVQSVKTNVKSGRVVYTLIPVRTMRRLLGASRAAHRQRRALIRTAVAFMSFGKESDSLPPVHLPFHPGFTPCFTPRVQQWRGAPAMRVCLTAWQATAATSSSSSSSIRNQTCVDGVPYHSERPTTHDRAGSIHGVAHDHPTRWYAMDGTRVTAPGGRVCVARTFLNADTSPLV